jgi:hypothetical protein
VLERHCLGAQRLGEIIEELGIVVGIVFAARLRIGKGRTVWQPT